MCFLMDEPDAEWMAFLAQTEAPVYKYRAATSVRYDAATGLVEVELGVGDIAIAEKSALIV